MSEDKGIEMKAGKAQESGRRYWRSLDEMAGKPEFEQWLHREFPQGASEAEGVNRRGFLKLMSASFALAGLGATGCRRPESYILPYGRQPEGSIPGIPVYFASAYPAVSGHVPIVVETHQHRPTHIEGNAKYGATGGAIHAQVAASVLDLYDADRMTHSYEGTRRITRERVKDILAGVNAKYGQTLGQGLAVLARPEASPVKRRLKAEYAKAYPRAGWYEYDPSDSGNAERALAEIFGEPVRAEYKMGVATRILTVDADILGGEGDSLGQAKGFAAGRRVANSADAAAMSRLYTAESVFTITGTMADHRLRLATSNMGAFLALVAAELMERKGGDMAFARELRSRAGKLEIMDGWIAACVEDLLAHAGASLVVVGRHLGVEVQMLGALVNELLEANGRTVVYRALPAAAAEGLEALLPKMASGEIETLVILGGNPGYDAPGDSGFVTALRSVGQVIRVGYRYDETGLEAAVNIASSHYLEAWSDGETADGTYVPVQPMIEPLFDTFSDLEVLARLVGLSKTDGYGLVQESYAARAGGLEQLAFDRWLSEGYMAGSAHAEAGVSVRTSVVKEGIAKADLGAKALSEAALEIRIKPDTSVGAGEYSNNGWMQECPDPMTKLTWDNAIIISPKLAKAKGFDTKSGDFLIGGVAKKSARFKRGREESRIAELTVGGVTVRGPVHILPGMADYTVLVNLGYGRRRAGRVGNGAGFDVNPLVSLVDRGVRTGAQLQITEEGYRLANTQEHWSMEGRAILREANVSTHLKDAEWVDKVGMESHSPPVYGKDKDLPLAEKSLTTPRGGSAYETPNFGDPPPNVDIWKDAAAREQFIPEQQWGMSIDLNTCLGCQACIVACQSENNIPIVGKDQIMRGREMHWIRLDRYFSSGDVEANSTELPSDPQASIMPVGCQHCEMAPCEQVCPVNATVHDNQGLNVMAYNRCVGTRYCANNCPYKVRRFNFFDYNKRSTEEFYAGPLGRNEYKTEGGVLRSMQRNPDVTVRMRGVMEKCTYCVQRIEQAKIAQRVKAKDSNAIHIPDGVLRTACQAACPTESIVFGDISDPESAVSKAKANDRDYALLGYLNTRPRTTYLGRLRNPNPAMPDYDTLKVAHSRQEYKDKQPKVSGKGEHAAEAAGHH